MKLSSECRQNLLKAAFALCLMLLLSSIITFGLGINLASNAMEYSKLLPNKSIDVLASFTLIDAIFMVLINAFGVYIHWKFWNYGVAEEEKNDKNKNILTEENEEIEFNAGQYLDHFKKWQILSSVIFGLHFCLTITGLSLWISTSATKQFEEGLLNAMKSYGQEITIKKEINELQINFQCCGSKSYTDWFTVKWLSKNSDSDGATNDAPWSCCDPAVFRPCIHRRIKESSPSYNPTTDLTLYKSGCATKVSADIHLTVQIITIVLAPLTIMQLASTVCSRISATGLEEASRTGEFDVTTEAWIFSKKAEKNNNFSRNHYLDNRKPRRRNNERHPFHNYRYQHL